MLKVIDSLRIKVVHFAVTWKIMAKHIVSFYNDRILRCMRKLYWSRLDAVMHYIANVFAKA